MSPRLKRELRIALAAAGLVIGALAVGGCATVKPYEREHLADVLMSDPGELAAAMREMKWLDAREGSTGGAGGAGGGCACK